MTEQQQQQQTDLQGQQQSSAQQQQSGAQQQQSGNLSIDEIYASFQQNPGQNSQQQSSDSGSQQQQQASGAQQQSQGSEVLGLIQDLTQKVDTLEKTHQESAVNKQMNEVLDKLNAHAGVQDRDLLRALVDVKVDKDPRLGNVFKNMDTDPQMFDKAMEALGKDIASTIKQMPNQQVTEHANALNAAHQNFSEQGANTGKSAFEEKLADMSPDQVAAELRNLAAGG